MNKEQLRERDARQLLANPVFSGAIEKLEASLDAQILATDPDNKEKCARVVVSKQLLKGLVREINRYIENGEIQELVELERKKRTLREVVFKR